MKKEIDNEYSDDDLKLNIHNIYKHRWVWYHTLLFVAILFTNSLLIAILVILALK